MPERYTIGRQRSPVHLQSIYNVYQMQSNAMLSYYSIQPTALLCYKLTLASVHAAIVAVRLQALDEGALLHIP